MAVRQQATIQVCATTREVSHPRERWYNNGSQSGMTVEMIRKKPMLLITDLPKIIFMIFFILCESGILLLSLKLD